MGDSNLVKSGEQHLILPAQAGVSLTRALPDFVATGFRYKGTLITCFLGIAVLATVASFLAPQRYESQAKILVKHERTDPVVTPGAEPISPREAGVSTEELNSEVELIGSEDLLRKIVLNQGLTGSASNEQKQERNIAMAINMLRSQLKVEVMPKTDVLAISYSSYSREHAAQIVDAIVSAYLEKHIAVHNSNDLEFFDEQVAKYADELQKASASLAQFTGSKTGAVLPAEQFGQSATAPRLESHAA